MATVISLPTLLLERRRLAVAGLLAAPRHAGGARSDVLADLLGLPVREVLTAIGDLRGAGLVEEVDGAYRLVPTTLTEAAAHAAEAELPMDPAIGYGMTDEERTVLARYFSGRVLHEIPAGRAKRLVVLERLALEFDVGRHYTEQEVNAILGAFHPDWSALRRHLVDEGLLDRDHHGGVNRYWRSGGRVTGLPAG